MTSAANGKGKPVTQMSVGEMRIAMRNTVDDLEEQKRRGITVEQLGPGKINEAFRKGFEP